MTISFIGSAAGSSSPNVDTTVTLPGSMSTDDLILVAQGIADNDAVDQAMSVVTAGYTEVAQLFRSSGATERDINFLVAYKYHNGSDTTVVVDGLGGTDAASSAVVMVFRGVALVADGGPFDTAATTATGIDTFNPDPPSIDHSGAAGIWTVIAGSAGHNVGTVGANSDAFTMPTGYTTNPVNQGHGDTSDVTTGMGYKSSPADPENPGVMTHNGTDDATYAWAAVTMALKEAAAPGGGPAGNISIMIVGL